MMEMPKTGGHINCASQSFLRRLDTIAGLKFFLIDISITASTSLPFGSVKPHGRRCIYGRIHRRDQETEVDRFSENAPHAFPTSDNLITSVEATFSLTFLILFRCRLLPPVAAQTSPEKKPSPKHIPYISFRVIDEPT